MSTQIIDQKYFKDENDNIYCIDIMPLNEKTWTDSIKKNWVAISKEEALSIANPPPTYDQLKQQDESLIAGLRVKVDFDILPLQDAVDIDDATDEEITRLKQLKKFRVTLNRWQYPEPIPTYPAPEALEFV